MPGADELCKRRTYSLYDEDLVRLSRLEERFGRSASEVIRLALQSIEGNQRILRHATAQHVAALQMLAHLVRDGVARGEEAAEVSAGLARVAADLARLVAPPEG